MPISRSESKKRKKDEPEVRPVETSPKRTKVHAQRKFAQGANLGSPSLSPVKDRDRQRLSNNPTSSLEPILPTKRPNTEDFLTFLCFRNTSILPPKLDFFKEAYRSDAAEAGPSKTSSSTSTSAAKPKTVNGETTTKKTDKTKVSTKSQPVAVQALKRKYQQQRLAKQKLAQKGETTKTRSMVAPPPPSTNKPSTVIKETKPTESIPTGLRSGLKRKVIKKKIIVKKKPVQTKPSGSRGGLRSGGKVIEGTSRALVKKAIKQTIARKTKLVKVVPKVENKDVTKKSKEDAKISDFSSDDNEPLLVKPSLRGRPETVSVVRTRFRKESQQTPLRPMRKTKEAAAIYMEMLTKKLVSPDRSGEDDRSSVESFPELPNAKRSEQRESEIRAEVALAKKNANFKDPQIKAKSVPKLEKRVEVSKKLAVVKEQDNKRNTKGLVVTPKKDKNTRSSSKESESSRPSTRSRGQEEPERKIKKLTTLKAKQVIKKSIKNKVLNKRSELLNIRQTRLRANEVSQKPKGKMVDKKVEGEKNEMIKRPIRQCATDKVFLDIDSVLTDEDDDDELTKPLVKTKDKTDSNSESLITTRASGSKKTTSGLCSPKSKATPIVRSVAPGKKTNQLEKTTKQDIGKNKSDIPKNSVPPEKVTTNTHKTSIASEKPASATQKNLPAEKAAPSTPITLIASVKSASDVKKDSVPPQKSTTNTKKTLLVSEKPAPAKQKLTSTEKSDLIPHKNVVPADKSVSAKPKLTTLSEKHSSVVQKHTEKSATVVQKLLTSDDKPISVTQKPVVPAEKSTLVAQKTPGCLNKLTSSEPLQKLKSVGTLPGKEPSSETTLKSKQKKGMSLSAVVKNTNVTASPVAKEKVLNTLTKQEQLRKEKSGDISMKKETSAEILLNKDKLVAKTTDVPSKKEATAEMSPKTEKLIGSKVCEEKKPDLVANLSTKTKLKSDETFSTTSKQKSENLLDPAGRELDNKAKVFPKSTASEKPANIIKEMKPAATTSKLSEFVTGVKKLNKLSQKKDKTEELSLKESHIKVNKNPKNVLDIQKNETKNLESTLKKDVTLKTAKAEVVSAKKVEENANKVEHSIAKIEGLCNTVNKSEAKETHVLEKHEKTSNVKQELSGTKASASKKEMSDKLKQTKLESAKMDDKVEVSTKTDDNKMPKRLTEKGLTTKEKETNETPRSKGKKVSIKDDKRSLRKKPKFIREEQRIQRPVRQCSTGEKMWVETDSDESDDSYEFRRLIESVKEETMKEAINNRQTPRTPEVKMEEPIKTTPPPGDHFTDSDEEPLQLKTEVIKHSPSPRLEQKTSTTPQKKEETMEELSKRLMNEARKKFNINETSVSKNVQGKSEISNVSIRNKPAEISDLGGSLEQNPQPTPNMTVMCDTVTDAGKVMKYTYTFPSPEKTDTIPKEPINTHGLDLLSEVVTLGGNASTERIEKWLKDSMASKYGSDDSQHIINTSFSPNQELRIGEAMNYQEMPAVYPEQRRILPQMVTQPYMPDKRAVAKELFHSPPPSTSVPHLPLPGPSHSSYIYPVSNQMQPIITPPQVPLQPKPDLKLACPGLIPISTSQDMSRTEIISKQKVDNSEKQKLQARCDLKPEQGPRKVLSSVQELLKLQKERKEKQANSSDGLPHSRNCKCNSCVVKKAWFKNKVMPPSDVNLSTKVEGEKPFTSLSSALKTTNDGNEKISASVAPMQHATTSTSTENDKQLEKKPIFQQKKSFLERMKERERKESKINVNPFSVNNESSVYAFDPEPDPKPNTNSSSPVKVKTRDSTTSIRPNDDKHCSSSIAVQVNLDTEVEAVEENQDKCNEISTQTEVGEEDSNSHMFYIPLQPNVETCSSSQQMVQGLALKFDTDSSVGSNQRVIMMKAKIVTNTPTTPTRKAIVMPQPKRVFEQAKSNNPPVGTVQPTTRKPVDEERPESTSSATSRSKGSDSESCSSTSRTKTTKRTKPKEEEQPKLELAPTFYPSEKDFQDPLEYFEKIRSAAEVFGLCRIIPPSSFKPDCKIQDDMRFTAYNQYVHRMLDRWGPNVREMMAIKKYLATQSISLKQPPLVGGIEIDLPRFYQCVQNSGGLMKVMEKKKWSHVADLMKIPKAAQDRVTKLDDIYCKYLLPYDTLSPDEREKLLNEVDKDWEERQKNDSSKDSSADTTDDESTEEESYMDECEECIVKGKSMALNQFFRVARNNMSMWFKNSEPTPQEVESEFWKHVTEKHNHVCVHSGSIDSSGCGYGFPTAKNCSFSKHPWNLKVLTNNNGSVLRSLGPVMGVTVPTLHVGMVFTAFCWYRDPHGLPWIEYLHSGASKIWYGISDDNSDVFHEALKKLLPRYIKNKTIWLPSDTAMVPPNLLVEHGVSLCHVTQEPGQFIIVFPRAFTSSICTGYLVSESVYFAQSSWLAAAEQVFKHIQESCEPSMFSLEKLLFYIATDSRTSVDVLKQVLPMVWHVRQKEIDNRKTLFNLGLKASERLPEPESGNKKRRGRWVQDDEGDYECDICRSNLFVSLVTNSNDDLVYCLPHAVELLTQKRQHLKHCKLLYAYSQEEMNEIIEKLEARIEMKNQKKLNSKSPASCSTK